MMSTSAHAGRARAVTAVILQHSSVINGASQSFTKLGCQEKLSIERQMVSCDKVKKQLNEAS